MIFGKRNTKVFSTGTNANVTKVLIICQKAGLEPGHDYVFQTRVKAECGFGAEGIGIGYYASGKFCFGL